MNKEELNEFSKDLDRINNDIDRLSKHCGWYKRTIQRVEDYGKFIAIDFLDFATGRNLEVSLGVFVDSEGTYDDMEEYYEVYLKYKKSNAQ